MRLLNIDKNAKIKKGKKKGYSTAALHLAPYKLSGHNVCPMSSKGCRESCLNTAGRGIFSRVQKSRIKKTKFFFKNRAKFMLQLEKEIKNFIGLSQKKKLVPCIRLNTLSDIPFEKIGFISKDGNRYKNIMERFPTIQFYDYTKRFNRNNLPSNYSLTFSLDEKNEKKAREMLKKGTNVAVVFRTPKFPKKFFGRKVIDGDETDLRFLDPKKIIVGLSAKGKAKYDTSGFVK